MTVAFVGRASVPGFIPRNAGVVTDAATVEPGWMLWAAGAYRRVVAIVDTPRHRYLWVNGLTGPERYRPADPLWTINPYEGTTP